MILAKLLIVTEGPGKSWIPLPPVLFNPNEITIQKTVGWEAQDKPQQSASQSQFTHGQASTLSLDLFFDTYEQGIDVRVLTTSITALALVEGILHRPPICQLIWGQGIFFQGVLVHLEQRYTLFLPDGIPARAILKCTFREFVEDEFLQKLVKLESVDVAKTRTVQRGDSLSSIAAEEYNNPALWRPIAEENRIDDPRHLTPGQVLSIPALSPGSIKSRA